MDILIVDDEPITRIALCAAVEDWGFTGVLAKDGSEALEILNGENPPHLLIIDWSMPGITGPELCKAIRKRSDGQFFYILMLTGREGSEAVVEAMEAGADDFVSKPFDNRVLKVRIGAGSRIVRLEQTLNQLASRDALTQCWNRRMIDEMLQNAFTEATRNKTTYSIMLIDADHFKRVNDNFGHSAGDSALQHLVKIMHHNLREYDHVGRFGGEEFVVLLPGTDMTEAWGVAERIRSATQYTPVITGENKQVQITVSIGLAEFSILKDEDTASLFKRADDALYEAKNGGRNRVVAAD